jgi:hypothetical protein
MKSVLWQRISKSRAPLSAGLALVALLLATETEARAYTDPGSGMLIWQMLAAAVVGVGFYFRKIISWFRPGKKDRQD